MVMAGEVGRGSSLQAQGTLPRWSSEACRCRFIPAGAGNTSSSDGCLSWWAVHPCRRREHKKKKHNTLNDTGSSLQAQGTRRDRFSAWHESRFIPAGAGNTHQRYIPPQVSTVHPCRRREHGNRLNAPFIKSGSSLQAQGTLQEKEQAHLASRFIPAGAGNTYTAPADY